MESLPVGCQGSRLKSVFFWLCCVFTAACGLPTRALTAWASVVVALRLKSTGSVIVAHGLSCSVA